LPAPTRNPSYVMQGTKSDIHVAVSSTNLIAAKAVLRSVAPDPPYPFGEAGRDAAPTGGLVRLAPRRISCS
jgi:hypothetical protein